VQGEKREKGRGRKEEEFYYFVFFWVERGTQHEQADKLIMGKTILWTQNDIKRNRGLGGPRTSKGGDQKKESPRKPA